MPYAATRVLHVTLVAWDHVDVDVEDGLSSRLTHVDANVVSVRSM